MDDHIVTNACWREVASCAGANVSYSPGYHLRLRRAQARPRDSGMRIPSARPAVARVPGEIAARMGRGWSNSEATIKDLGVGGAFVRLAVDVDHGARVEILLEHSGRTLRLPAVVRWTDADGFCA